MYLKAQVDSRFYSLKVEENNMGTNCLDNVLLALAHTECLVVECQGCN